MAARTAPVPLVLGVAGIAGRAVASAMEEAHPETISATRVELDVTDRFRIEAEIERLRPTVVINCAGISGAEACAIDPDRAHRVNAEGAENVARAAASVEARVIQLSTDCVFDGRAGRPYVESDPAKPISEYGRSRLDGEQRVAAVVADHLIVRTSWLYGPGRLDVIDSILQRSADGGVLRAADDQFGSPTSAADLGGALLRLLEIDYRGVIHFANSGRCSRFELARMVVETLAGRGVSVERTTTAVTGQPAARPYDGSLDPSLYARITGTAPRSWRVALAEYVGALIDDGSAARRDTRTDS